MPGVSTRMADDLTTALGLDEMLRSELLRICGELDPLVEADQTRSTRGDHLDVSLDATCHRVQLDGRAVSETTVVAIDVTLDGGRQILGIDVGAPEDWSFWSTFILSLVKRGLTGVRLVILDAHEGPNQAITTVLGGPVSQRRPMHLISHLLTLALPGLPELVVAILRTVFAQPSHTGAIALLQKAADSLRTRLPQAATSLEGAAEDLRARKRFPNEHRREYRSRNPVECSSKGLRLRSDIVGSSPTPTRWCARSASPRWRRTMNGPWSSAAASARS